MICHAHMRIIMLFTRCAYGAVNSSRASSRSSVDEIEDLSSGSSMHDELDYSIPVAYIEYRIEDHGIYLSMDFAQKMNSLGFMYPLAIYSFNGCQSGPNDEIYVPTKTSRHWRGKGNHQALAFLVSFFGKFIEKDEKEYSDILHSEVVRILYFDMNAGVSEMFYCVEIYSVTGKALDLLLLFLVSIIRRDSAAELEVYKDVQKSTFDGLMAALVDPIWHFPISNMLLIRFAQMYHGYDRISKSTDMMSSIHLFTKMHACEADRLSNGQVEISDRDGLEGAVRILSVAKHFRRRVRDLKINISKSASNTLKLPEVPFINLEEISIDVDIVNVDIASLESIYSFIGASEKLLKVSLCLENMLSVVSPLFPGGKAKQQAGMKIMKSLLALRSLCLLKLILLEADDEILKIVRDVIANNAETLNHLELNDINVKMWCCSKQIFMPANCESECGVDRVSNKRRRIGCSDVTVSEIYEAISKLQRLTILLLLDFPFFSRQNITRLFSNARNSKIEKLNVCQYFLEADDSLDALIGHVLELPNINVFRISGFNGAHGYHPITISITDIRRLMTRVEYLDLSYSTISLESRPGYEDVKRQRLVTIKISVSGCRFVQCDDYTGLKTLLMNALLLKAIDITDTLPEFYDDLLEIAERAFELNNTSGYGMIETIHMNFLNGTFCYTKILKQPILIELISRIRCLVVHDIESSYPTTLRIVARIIKKMKGLESIVIANTNNVGEEKIEFLKKTLAREFTLRYPSKDKPKYIFTRVSRQ